MLFRIPKRGDYIQATDKMDVNRVHKDWSPDSWKALMADYNFVEVRLVEPPIIKTIWALCYYNHNNKEAGVIASSEKEEKAKTLIDKYQTNSMTKSWSFYLAEIPAEFANVPSSD